MARRENATETDDGAGARDPPPVDHLGERPQDPEEPRIARCEHDDIRTGLPRCVRPRGRGDGATELGGVVRDEDLADRLAISYTVNWDTGPGNGAFLARNARPTSACSARDCVCTGESGNSHRIERVQRVSEHADDGTGAGDGHVSSRLSCTGQHLRPLEVDHYDLAVKPSARVLDTAISGKLQSRRSGR